MLLAIFLAPSKEENDERAFQAKKTGILMNAGGG
jgi:hypothetical protein